MPDKIKSGGGAVPDDKSLWRTVGDEGLSINAPPPPQQDESLMGKVKGWLGGMKGDPNAPQEQETSEGARMGTRFTNGQRGRMTPDPQDLEPLAAISVGEAGGAVAPALRGLGGAALRGAATTGGGYLAEHGLRGQMPSLKGAAIAAGTGAIGGPLLEYGGGTLLSKILKRAGIGKGAGEVAGAGETAASDIEKRAADAPYEGPDKRLMSRKTGKPVYENLHAEHEARMKAAGLATPESQAAETGTWHAGHGGGIPNPSAITPENRRLIQKLMDSGLIPRE